MTNHAARHFQDKDVPSPFEGPLQAHEARRTYEDRSRTVYWCPQAAGEALRVSYTSDVSAQPQRFCGTSVLTEICSCELYLTVDQTRPACECASPGYKTDWTRHPGRWRCCVAMAPKPTDGAGHLGLHGEDKLAKAASEVAQPT